MDLGFFGSATFGAALLGAGKLFWNWFERKDAAPLKAKDEIIVLLKQRNAVLEAEVARKEETIGMLGKKCDEERKKCDAEREKRENVERRAGVVLGKMRLAPEIDETEFEEKLTTGIRDMADLIASAKPKSDPPDDSLPPGVKEEIDRYNRGGQ